MLEGLMQHDTPLTLQLVLRRMVGINGRGTVATFDGEKLDRITYAGLGRRIEQLGLALRSLGVTEGERVATFAWNSQRHLELYYAIPCLGAVLHTLNIRLFAEQITYIVEHAQDRIIFIDDSLIPLLAPLVDQLHTVEHYVVMGDGPADGLPAEKVLRYEELLAAETGELEWPEIDDRQAAGLCYTSGTTGNPKGVLYSHKSTVVHSIAAALGDALDLKNHDVVLPIVPMFHAMAWGLPYTCGLIGASLVMPGKFLQAEPLTRLIKQEKITYAGAVPTIWMDVLRYADTHEEVDLSTLRMVPCGGAAVPRALMEPFEQRHGVRIVQAWGMTETSPLGAVAHAPAGVEGEERWSYRLSAGKVAPLVEARLIGDDGEEVPWDGTSTGELEVRGTWIASGYYGNPDDAGEKFHDGWLRTGDIASIDRDGYIRISDRAKDVIKSGGEWISSVELESELMAHPQVREAAVVAMPDDRWTERPLACIVLEDGASLDPADLRSHLEPRVARWWLPDAFAQIPEVPKTSVGKFDKKVLRAQLQKGELDVVRVGQAAEPSKTATPA